MKLCSLASILFKNTNFELIPISEFSDDDIEETGISYEENAFIKAKFASDISGLPSLGDDSGLEVEALDGAPGIYSARWGGKKGDFKKAINRVYKELSKKDKNWKYKKIKARFICALSICYLDKKIASVFGKLWQRQLASSVKLPLSGRASSRVQDHGKRDSSSLKGSDQQLPVVGVSLELKDVSHLGTIFDGFLRSISFHYGF